MLPGMGASGAIAAILGAYAVLFPRARVVSLVPILFIPLVFEVPALLWICFWFFEQAVNGLASLLIVPMGGVAWWAHIGGFLFGIAVAIGQKFGTPVPEYRFGYDQEWPFASTRVR
jgi:membrane associated rhomboid family serine protease